MKQKRKEKKNNIKNDQPDLWTGMMELNTAA